MTILHKEGRQTLLILGAICAILVSVSYTFMPTSVNVIVWIILICFYLFIISFFRNPERKVPIEFTSLHDVIAPADGKVVAIEEIEDDEFIPGRWLQVSIFMSPLNVHVNRHPVSGEIMDYAYHPGKYLVAWNPKSSMENERTSILYKVDEAHLKLRQVAGAVARRIVSYCTVGDKVIIGQELGFIKFGSRVDILLPTDSKLEVTINQKVRGNKDRIAILPH